MAKKEKEINSQAAIPEQTWNRADTAIRDSALESPFTQREKTTFPSEYAAGGGTFVGGLPTFPYGGRSSTSLDASSYFGAIGQNNTMAQYERDAGTRMANRYTASTGDLLMRDPFGSRMSNTSYSNPITMQNIEQDNYYNRPSDIAPSVGTSGVSRSMVTPSLNQISEQIVSPYGFAQTTLNQTQDDLRAKSIQQAKQTGTMPRTPQQQQELLARMRTQGATIRESIASNARDSFGTKTPAQKYTTPSGSSIVAPTNMFGQPIQSFSDVYAARSPINEAALARMRGRPSAATFNSGILASTGFGAMQREQNEMMSPPIRSQSLFGGMGYAAAFGGGPQPESSMVAGNSMVGRTRRRLFGTV
jgi:hypothetical protein